MDYIKEPKLFDQVLIETFNSLSPIYEDDSRYQTVKLYDIRDKSIDAKIYNAVRTVFGVVREESGEFLLIEHPKRGWEICGGHLTAEEVQNQDLHRALEREIIEESGYRIQSPEIAFLAHVENKQDSINKELGCYYPRNALMAIFTCNLGDRVTENLLDDIIQAKVFPKDEALKLVKSRNKAIIEAL